jgi:hypothetical protein
MSKDLLCKDCKHSFRKWSEFPQWGLGHEYRCRKTWNPETVEHDPVLGSRKVHGHFSRCSLVRLHEANYKNNCGKEGKWWEPKNKKLLFLAIKHSENLK